MSEQPLQGRVVSAHGRHYAVETGGVQRICTTRGKRTGVTVGDQVMILPDGPDQGVITQTLPRRNLLYRSDAMRSKQFAANIDQLLIVLASEPPFSDDLLGRALVAAHSAGISAAVILNKADLASAASARERLSLIESLGIPVIMLSALDTGQVQSVLGPMLQGRSTLLLGQSGMGKSTLLNALVPGAQAPTREHSHALSAGRHTTTHTRSYALAGGGDIIDSPGFQAFGLLHLEPQAIVQGFPEFAEPAGKCRFHDCSHRHEPGCGILAALADGLIDTERHALYMRILSENEAARKW